MAASVGKVDDDTMLAVFTNGLEERIRAELLVHNPRSLKEAINLAIRIETKWEVLAQGPKPSKEPSYKPDTKTIAWIPQKNYNPISNSKNLSDSNTSQSLKLQPKATKVRRHPQNQAGTTHVFIDSRQRKRN